jgi:hypothetical protein
MSGHTKGPWFLEGEGDFREISAPEHQALARVVWQMEDDRICGESSPTQEANARLIVASPDMLHALRLVRASTEWACMESSTQDAVLAAINKAEL